MNEPPWLQPNQRRLVHFIVSSHTQAFRRPLLSCQSINDSNRLESQELFALGIPVMAHDERNDPHLIYANAAALFLWRRKWAEMIGMPSRLTAPINERNQRTTALNQALQQNSITGYRGIRIDNEGRQFLINDARIWTLWDDQGDPIGQAATFNSWDWI